MRTGATNQVSCTNAHALLSQSLPKPHTPGNYILKVLCLHACVATLHGHLSATCGRATFLATNMFGHMSACSRYKAMGIGERATDALSVARAVFIVCGVENWPVAGYRCMLAPDNHATAWPVCLPLSTWLHTTIADNPLWFISSSCEVPDCLVGSFVLQ